MTATSRSSQSMGRGSTCPAAIGYAKASKELRDSIDAVLPEVSKLSPRCWRSTGSAPTRPRRPASPTGPPRSRRPGSSSRRRRPPRRRSRLRLAPRRRPPRRRRPGRRADPDGGARDRRARSGQAGRRRDGRIRRRAARPARDARADRRGQGGIQRHLRPLPRAGRGQSVKKIDLRRLTLRYGDGAHNMYWKTVHEGRPAKGMPTWKGVFTDEQFTEIFAFLSTIQAKE